MRVKRLELNNFRNYETLELDFESIDLCEAIQGQAARKMLIIGQNAQGKTNLLEAVYYLSSLNSARIKKDSELILFGRDSCKIKGTVFKDGVDVDLEVIINPPKNKVFKVNGLKKNKSSDFIRVLSVVNFSVNDLLLLRGEPGFRRKWLDGAICQIYPVYAEKIAKYNKIRLQKANLLAGAIGTFADATGGANQGMLDVFNQQLATSGANIIFLRKKFLNELEKIAVQKHYKIAQGEILALKYDCDFINLSTAKEIETALLIKLEEMKNDEIRRAQCLIGPHRDDISFFINNIDAKKFASQGQQRTIVLALKLAELEIVKDKNNDTPVLLLDDVLAELDEKRQNYLLDGIEQGIQTIITCTDTKAFSDAFLANLQIVRIEQGKVM